MEEIEWDVIGEVFVDDGWYEIVLDDDGKGKREKRLGEEREKLIGEEREKVKNWDFFSNSI